MKRYIFLALLTVLTIINISSQEVLNIEGKAKVTVMDTDNAAQFIVVKQADGTLAIRDVSTISDSDNDPTNEIQDLSLSSNILTITANGSATQIDLSPYLDNTDDQKLDVSQLTGMNLELSLEGDGEATKVIDLSSLKDGTGSWTVNIDTTSTDKFVCIGKTHPKEKLEVNGAINIGTNEDSSPEAGTIRWNTVTQDFEGYTGTKWMSLTNRVWGGSDDIEENQKLTASDAAADDLFGYDVSISGDYAIVGAVGENGHGSAYIFIRSGTTWSQQAKLTASDAAAGDNFGYSVSISGDYAIIGAEDDDDNGLNSGSAYVFVRSGTTWSQQAKLLAADGAADDAFGRYVSISGDYAIIGAWRDDDNGDRSGSAYVFIRSGTTWSQQAKLIASDGAAYDNFGYSVSISGDYAIVGAYANDDNGSASGSAYVFVRSGTSWSQQAKLTASDAAGGDYFGSNVSISGDYIVVGAEGNNDNGTDSGSAYVFVRSGTSWSQQAKLTAADAAADDLFGHCVSISGDFIIVGAYWDDDHGTKSGSAYVFVRSGTSWSQQAKLTASDAAADDEFGESVSVSGNYIIVGVFRDDDHGSQSGSAYIFER